jgi:polar amino acid transport system substrate-binding protein
MAKLVCALLIMQLSTNVRSELVPTGKLRVGINFGNALLASKKAGVEGGIAVDLARELARRLNVPMEIVSYDSAGQMADGAKAGRWDVAFLGADPDRANEIAFTAPYLEIDTTYLVPPGSSLRNLADVDRVGVRIAVSEKSAYDLFLTRSLKHATLVRVPGVGPSVDLYFAQKLDALAGLRPILVDAAAKRPGSRVLEGSFTVVEQALGTPKGRESAVKYLREFIEDVKQSGFVSKAIEKNGIRGVSVAH